MSDRVRRRWKMKHLLVEFEKLPNDSAKPEIAFEVQHESVLVSPDSDEEPEDAPVGWERELTEDQLRELHEWTGEAIRCLYGY